MRICKNYYYVHYHSNSQRTAPCSNNGSITVHAPEPKTSQTSSINSQSIDSKEMRSRAMTKSSFVDSENSGSMKRPFSSRSISFSKSLKIPLQSNKCKPNTSGITFVFGNFCIFIDNIISVSYTHLTLPTNREV